MRPSLCSARTRACRVGNRADARFIAALLFACTPTSPASAYSVLSHEAIIDAAWDTAIKPILLERFPDASGDDLRKAHAYAYGGAIIQDMGYYPFGSHLFSDLVHYIRSGDFILNEIAEAQDLNEYAFALGSLSHYAADNTGHPVATNLAVPMLYPKVRQKFGRMATYEDNPDGSSQGRIFVRRGGSRRASLCPGRLSRFHRI